MTLCLETMDPGSRDLTIAVLSEDVRDSLAKIKGKQRGDVIDDAQVALGLCLADLEAEACLASDRAMAESIAQAVHRDEGIIAALLAQEKQDHGDHGAALQLDQDGRPGAGAPPPGRDDERPAGPPDIDDDLCAKLEALFNIPPGEAEQYDSEEDAHPAESSSWAASLRTRGGAAVRECLICNQRLPFRDLARLPCSHEYCRACLERLFTSCLVDESLYPPRCCGQRIPEHETQVRMFLGGALLGAFLARRLELDTPDKTYCHRAPCSTFIPPQGIRGATGTCPQCRAETCCICKAAAHVGADCPDDEAAQQVLALAAREGWRECFGCKRLVELTLGCYHMTCLCGAEFCYNCGRAWTPGGCQCPSWDEGRLLERATEIVARDPAFAQQPEARRVERVRRQRALIIENHECQHRQWRKRQGAFKCENCNMKMWYWIHECQECELNVCARCRHNRL